MTTPNPVEASTSTPDASTAPNPSRGVNGTASGHPSADHPKDATAPDQDVPALLLWALAIALTIAFLAIPTALLLTHP